MACTDFLGRRVHSGSLLYGVALVGPVAKPVRACFAELVAVDEVGGLWLVASGSRGELVRRSLVECCRVYPGVVELVRDAEAGRCLLWPARDASRLCFPWRATA